MSPRTLCLLFWSALFLLACDTSEVTTSREPRAKREGERGSEKSPVSDATLRELPKVEPCRGEGSWATALAGGRYAYSRSLGLDAAGDVLVAGTFRGELQVGTRRLLALGKHDIFLARFDACGRLRDSQVMGSVAYDQSQDLATDPQRHVYLTGSFCYFGSEGCSGSFGRVVLPSRGQKRAFVVKQSPEGETSWGRAFYGEKGSEGRKIVVGPQGDLYVLGRFEGSIVLGSRTHSAAGEGLFLARLRGEDGGVVWSLSLGGAKLDAEVGLSVSSDGHLILAGSFSGRIRLGEQTLTARGDADVFVARVDGQGKPQWLRGLGGEGKARVSDVQSGDGGAIWLLGHFADSLKTRAGTLRAKGERDIFMARLDAQGQLQWQRSLGGGQVDEALGLALGPQGAVMLAGYFVGELEVDGKLAKGREVKRAFVLGLSAQGKATWLQTWKGEGTQEVSAVVARKGEGFALLGHFEGSMEIGGRALTAPKGGVFVLHSLTHQP